MMDKALIATAALVAACLLDYILGDPSRFPHPVRFIGAVIALLEKTLRRVFFSSFALRVAGAVMVILVAGFFTLLTFILLTVTYRFHPVAGFIIEVYILFAVLAGGDLRHHIQKVVVNLGSDNLEEARSRTSLLVSRDTAQLNESGISRAALESLFENSSDGLVAPLLFAAIGGPAAAVFYKTVSTFDSMIGYKNREYIDLGWFAARLDDLLNYIPARLSAVLIILSGAGNNSLKRGLKVLKKDSRSHESPNSAWPEAAAAGVLDVRLGGTDSYCSRKVERPLINAGGKEANRFILESGISIYIRMSFLAYILILPLSWWLRTMEVGIY